MLKTSAESLRERLDNLDRILEAEQGTQTTARVNKFPKVCMEIEES